MTKSKTVLVTVVVVGVIGLLGVNGYVLWKLNQIPSEMPAPATTLTVPPVGTPGGGGVNTSMTVAQRKAQNLNGPWNGNLVMTSALSLSGFGAPAITFVEEAGVPTLAKTSDGTVYALFQWFPDAEESFDKVATSISRDNGVTWSEPETIVFDGMPFTLQRAFDPTLVVLTDDTFRLYFTTSEKGEQNTIIASATSTDGIHFTFEGTAFSKADTRLYDCAVAYAGDHWIMTTPHAPNVGAYRAISTDGVTFTETDEIVSTMGENWLGNFMNDNDTLYFVGSASPEDIWYATSTDGNAWSTPISIGIQGGDPAMVRADDGTYIVVYTSPAVKK